MGCTDVIKNSMCGYKSSRNSIRSETSINDSHAWSYPIDESTHLNGVGGHAAYPPQVKQTQVLGYVKDISGIGYSRDIGRPFQLLGQTYLNFGDTFCKDANGAFLGISNNTAAIVRDKHQPLVTTYLEIEQGGMVKPFIPLNEEEEHLQKTGSSLVKLWGFGGVVELDDVTGAIWYQKSIMQADGREEYIGTGIALVTPLTQGRLSVQRLDGLVFGPEEPRVGTFSAVLHGSDVYLYGEMNHQIILARVSRNCTGDKGWYRFWNGKEYVKDCKEAVPVFNDIQHGAIVRSRLFGPARPWMFVGCNRWADSSVLIGASATLEGPWELTSCCKATGIDVAVGPDSYMYCMYPQLWASDERKAELMVTWCEKWPGAVVAAKLTLASIGEGVC